MKFDIEDVMKFNIEDIKSWSNRKDVKIGDKGYFFNKISNLHDLKENEYSKIESINDNQANCFFSTAFYGGYSFFLPLNAVKNEPKIKYRPFKNLYEFYKFLSYDNFTEGEFTPSMLLGLYFTYRDKKALRVASTIVINKIDVDLKDICEPIIEGRNFEHWFDYAEIRNDDGEWQPFGVKENE